MFERDTRTSRMQFPLWWMNVGKHDDPNKRRLVVEPYTMRGGSMPVELRVWIEDETPRYCYIVKSLGDTPKGLPEFRIESVVVEKSRRSVPAKTGLESIVIEALATYQLTGESAERALSQLFWTHFVFDDDGLTWLNKYASKDTGNFYALQRLVEYIRVQDNHGRDTHRARNAIEDVMKHDRDLGQRMCQRVYEDEAFQHAIEALLMTSDDDEVKHAHIRRIVELNATDKDRVFAGIVTATRSHALRGLRACQRAEHDAEFFEALAAIARREHEPDARSKCINAFLYKSRMKP